jgi:serine/threonine-protein kinase
MRCSAFAKLSPNGIIKSVVSTAFGGAYSGDGGAADKAQLFNPTGVSLNSAGGFFIADWGNNRVRRVSAHGVITTVAGGGLRSGSSYKGPAVDQSIAQRSYRHSTG